MDQGDIISGFSHAILLLNFNLKIPQITGRLAQEREYTRLIDTANAPIFGVNQFGRVNVWNKVSHLL